MLPYPVPSCTYLFFYAIVPETFLCRQFKFSKNNAAFCILFQDAAGRCAIIYELTLELNYLTLLLC